MRLALSGQLGKEGFTGPSVRDAMELCVGCKGCKRECPTGVDMAKMKVEFLGHYKKKHGLTLRDRLAETANQWSGSCEVRWRVSAVAEQLVPTSVTGAGE